MNAATVLCHSRETATPVDRGPGAPVWTTAEATRKAQEEAQVHAAVGEAEAPTMVGAMRGSQLPDVRGGHLLESSALDPRTLPEPEKAA
jgi:hypothetical protein